MCDMINKNDYVGKTWKLAWSIEVMGWSKKGLAEVDVFAKEIGATSVFIAQGATMVHNYGPLDQKFQMNSIRKSLMNVLLGTFYDQGKLKLDSTLADLKIDDFPNALTHREQRATVFDVLTSRSGVYIEPVSETTNMRSLRPKRGSHKNGEFFYYNNWSFNVLVTIAELVGKRPFFEMFNEAIAQPLAMKDFKVTDGRYKKNEKSIHPGYFFEMSPRDLARIGLLFMRDGKWRDQQIISKEWVDKTLIAYSDVKEEGGYGFLWWREIDGRLIPGIRLPKGSFMAVGYGGQFMLVIPSMELIVVNGVASGGDVSIENFGALTQKILASYLPKFSAKFS